MKLLYSLLFIIFSLGLIKSQSLYANFIPYQNSDCSGDSYGIGFTVSVGSGCIETDFNWAYDKSAWQFEVTDDKLLSLEYKGDGNCKSSELISKSSFANNTCSESLNFNPMLNGTIKGSNSTTQYAIVTITPQPQYQPNSQIYVQYSNAANGNCNNAKVLYATTLVGKAGTLELDYKDVGQSCYYICQNGQPFVKYCDIGTTSHCSTTNLFKTCNQSKFNAGNQHVYCTFEN